MVRLLGLNSRVGIDTAGGGGGGGGPREILKEPNEAGDSGWLIRFFDSTFFDEWIAISYLYKHEHAGVRDFLCNRMYTLPTSGIESYLYQLCFMVIHKPSAALDKFIIDMCSMSLRIAIKVHWFLLAESEDSIDSAHIRNLLEKCQTAALNGDWPPLIKPSKHSVSPGPKRMLKQLLSSRLLSPPNPKQSPPPHSSPVIEDATVRESNVLKGASEDLESTFKVFKKFVPGPKVRDALTLKKFREKEDEDVLRSKETDSDSFLRRLLFPQKEDEERAARSDEFSNPDGFFRRFLREKNDGEEKIGEEEKDGFFRRMSFFLKSDERDRNDSREKVDDEEKASMSGGEDDDGPDFFFLRRSRIHPEFDDKSGLPDGITGTPPEKTGESPGEGFFKKLFNNRSSDDNKSSSLKREDSTGNSPGSFLRRFIKERLDDESSSPSVDDGSVQGLPNQGTVVEGVAVGGQTWEKIKDWQYPVKNAPLLCDSESKDPGLLKPNERCADCTEEAELSGKGRKSTDETEELFWSETEESASKDAGVAAEKPSSEPFGFNVVQGQGVVSSPPKKSLSFSVSVVHWLDFLL